MLEDMDSDPGPQPGRQRDVGTRLDAVRARRKELRERDRATVTEPADTPSERLEVAQRHAAEALAAATVAVASSAEVLRRVADAHERVASVRERAAVAGIGDTLQHEQQAAFHREAAAADRQRAERAESLLAEAERPERAQPADEPGGAG
jgi:hypothetical protein